MQTLASFYYQLVFIGINIDCCFWLV